MPLELGLIEGDVFDRHGPLPGLMLQNPIHQGKGIPVRQQIHDLLAAHQGGLGRGGSRHSGNAGEITAGCDRSEGSRTSSQSCSQLGMEVMGRPERHHLRLRQSHQRQITN